MPTICITGATSGIGQDTARVFASAGWHCILAGRRTKQLSILVEELKPYGAGLCLPLVLDIRKMEDVNTAFEHLPQQFKNVEVLVNNAGLGLETSSFQHGDSSNWGTMVDTNIHGMLHCTHALLPGMIERGRGHIINMGSVAGSYATPGISVYSGTKAFVGQFSQSLRTDVHGSGVRVSVVEPGLVRSGFASVRFGSAEQGEMSAYAGKEVLESKDVADIVFWMAVLPPHININRLEVMPTGQSCGPFRHCPPATQA